MFSKYWCCLNVDTQVFFILHDTVSVLCILGVLPDIEFGELCVKVFGESSHVIRKFRRTLYWMRKFQNKNPYKLPHNLPFDPIKLALLALKKMAVDLNNELEVWKVCKQNLNSSKKKFRVR